MSSIINEKDDQIFHENKSYTIKDLIEMRKLWEDEFYKLPTVEVVDKYALKSLQLTEKQLSSLKKSVLTKKASSWKSRQRKLRREGKLDQYKIDELNKLGMLWNPLGDLWEINFSYFRQYGLTDPIKKWAKAQRTLFREKKLSDENFLRLSSTNFPFEESKDEEYRLDIYQIIFMIEQLTLGNKVYSDSYTKENFHSLKDRAVKKNVSKKPTRTQLGKINELNQMSYDDFKFEIDKLYSIEYKKEKASGIVKSRQKHYSEIYFESLKYINGVFKTGRVINYLEETVKYECSDEVIIYTSEKALAHLDNFMLHTGEYNDYTNFPPINKLIKYYSKNEMNSNLMKINKVICKYPILSAIYSDRINKVILSSQTPSSA